MAKKKEETKKETSQPEVNIGFIGHVDHGKTTLTERLSGKWTDTHSEELKRGITIRLGYANSTFYKCPKCKGEKAYGVKEKCSNCDSKCKLLRTVSFVDAPGHESLMATMLSGATIMDGAILMIAANEKCPQPQTREHLMALQIIGIKNIVVVQNKIDLVNEEASLKNYEEIKNFLKGTDYENAPIIPISAQHKLNIDLLIKTIEDTIKTPKRDSSAKTPVMFIARSFDVNKPGSEIKKLIGGVLGGSLKQGKFSIDEEIEINPGYDVQEHNQKIWKPIKTKIVGLMTGTEKVEEVIPGGSVALLTELDPSIVKSDALGGAIVTKPGKAFPVWRDLNMETHLLKRVVGSKEDLDVTPIKRGEILMLNVNSAATVGVVAELGRNSFECKLKRPVCAEIGSRVTISRMIGSRFRLIGYGVIKKS